MFPEPTELLLIGCLIESIWTPKSESNTLTPRTNSQTYWQREISHVMNGIIFCVCSTSAISVHQLSWSNVKKNTRRCRWRKSHSKVKDQWWVWLQGLPQLCHLRRQKVRGREVMKVRVPGVRKLRNMAERWNPLLAVTQVTRQGTTTSNSLKARTQHATQDGTMTKLGLLKSGKLMNWWMIERGHPLSALNEEEGHSNSSLETAKQNWICR